MSVFKIIEDTVSSVADEQNLEHGVGPQEVYLDARWTYRVAVASGETVITECDRLTGDSRETKSLDRAKQWIAKAGLNP